MIDKMKNNTKIKLISLMSAVALWLYVMAVVDPEETKLIEDLPITITNMSELKANDLEIYPDTELTTDIYLTGKLSSLQKIKPQDIHIYGQILNPIEGKNELRLSASISERVTPEFKTKVIIVPLEKIIEEKRSIDINIEGTSKDKIVDVMDLSVDSVKVSGPRSLVQQVQKVVGTIDIQNKNNDFSQEIKLVPVDDNGQEIIGVDLDEEYITVDIRLLKQKSVPIEIKLKEGSDSIENLKDYKLNQSNITIKGKSDVIDKIDKIYTYQVDLKYLIESGTNEVSLDIPEGVIVDNKNVKLIINTVTIISSEFSYTSEEVEIKNNVSNIDITKLDIPQIIKVTVEYNDDITNLDKSDILLYVDLSQITSDGKYEIKYQSEHKFNNITIQPDTVEVK